MMIGRHEKPKRNGPWVHGLKAKMRPKTSRQAKTIRAIAARIQFEDADE